MLNSFNSLFHKKKSKNKSTSNVKIQQILLSLALSNVGIYSGDGPFESDVGTIILHPKNGTLWVDETSGGFSDSYGRPPSEKLSEFIIKRNGNCLSSEKKIQDLTSKMDSNCPAYCLYIIYLTTVSRIDFKSAALNLNYRRFSLHNRRYGK